MPADSVPYRDCLIQVVGTLASGQRQLDYERRVPIAYVPDELVCQFFDDHYHPKSPQFIEEFTQDELIEIGIFSGLLEIASDEVDANEKPAVSDVLKLPRWRDMMARAQKTTVILKQGANKRMESND